MTFERLRDHALAKPETTEDFPFDEHTLVFRVRRKMFALIGLERRPLAVNLKCDPELAAELRARYEAVQPGYHMNKRHWNTVTLNAGLPDQDLLKLLDHSYDLVAASLKRADRDAVQTAGWAPVPVSVDDFE
ncbi:MAG: MmcQ/YjbR family DNA-binding protein [Bacteroidota bacterium]